MRTIILHIIVLLVVFACTTPEQDHRAHADSVAVDSTGQHFTCPMHPQIAQDHPGKCPICGMDLVGVTRGQQGTADLMLSDSQIKLANITTGRATRKPVGQTIVLNGRLAVDEQKSEVISSRVAGRIEKLFVKETGKRVVRGQPLYTLYSETLLTLQQEYLLAKEQYESLGQGQKRYKDFLGAAERKLLLYGLTGKQIAELSGRSSLRPQVTFLAPATGIVTEINTAEGQYVNEGGSLYKIEDISTLWVEAELYPHETSLVKVGDKVKLSVAESRPVEAMVTFLSPEIRNNTQITIMRASVANPEDALKPGQHAQVFLTHSTRESIAIPTDAVIRDQHGSHVYIMSGANTFRPQMVETGLEGFDEVEITEGLKEGDSIAVTGAYLLYSEIILKKGGDPMASHNH
jgi:Cu(I)/Ag(I) efflux system membrane fusion protein